jgi:hypothetical protein
MLTIKISFILLVAVAGCNIRPSMNTESQNHDSINSSQLPESDILSKDIVVFIGRGGCCYGHIISIDKNGNLQYSVGTYSLPASNGGEADAYLPETFDPNRIEVDKKYAQKNKKVSAEVLERLALLVRDEEKLRFQDKSLVFDAYHYNIYLDNKGIGYGYDSTITSFPANLRELITLVIGQVELHKLPGMA